MELEPFLRTQRTPDSSLALDLCSQHLGSIRMLEPLLEMLPAVLLAHLNVLKLTQICKSVLIEYLPFPLWWLDRGLFVSVYETLQLFFA